ncbi:MAG: hypothetical protein QW578_08185 [Thermoplasmatales archaeon]
MRVPTDDVKVMEFRPSLDVEAVHRIATKLRIGELIPVTAMIML